MDITGLRLGLKFLLPEAVLLAGLLWFLILLSWERGREEKSVRRFAITLGWLVAIAAAVTIGPDGFLFYRTYRVDAFTQIFKFLLSGAFAVVLHSCARPKPIEPRHRAEYYFLLTTALAGMMLMVSSTELVTFYISMELSSYSLYILTALERRRWSAEAALKYFLFGAAVSGLFLYGASFVVGLTGATHFTAISEHLPALQNEPTLWIAVFLMLGSLFFKLSSVPFHFWAPDAYEAAPTSVAAFIATASKATAVAVLIRFIQLFGGAPALTQTLMVFAFASMTIGNLVALTQKSMKRLLAYSSIAQAGYLILGLMAGTSLGWTAVIFYSASYVLMNLGAFMVTLVVADNVHHDNPQLAHFSGLAERSPLLSLVLLLSLLSLAGIPPLVGFTGKWILFSAAMDAGHWFLVLYAVINSVISLFYYLVVVKHVYLHPSAEPARPFIVPATVRVLSYALIVALVVLGVFPAILIGPAERATVALVTSLSH